MTTPTERMRHLVQAGAFLKDIRADASMPPPRRDEAARLLRHYPTIAELQQLAGGCDMLTSEIDPDWLRTHRFGAHVG